MNMKLIGLVTGIGMSLMMLAARPAAAQITITVGDATASAGGTATFAVTLAGVAAGGTPANNAQVDIVFDSTVFDVTAGTVCTVDPRLTSIQGLAHTESLPTSPAVPAGMKRIRLSVIDTGATLGLITDGTLYTCNFPVDAAAASAPTTLTAGRQNVGDSAGNTLTSSVVNGTVTISGGGGPTATPIPTAAATATPIPTPAGIYVGVGNATAAVGGTATFIVTLNGVAAGGTPANNAQVDIVFDSTVFDVTAGTVCTVDPRLTSIQGLAHTESLPTSPAVPAGMKRIRLSVIDTGATLGLITDGTLYTCNFPVDAAAAIGETILTAGRQNVGDSAGNTLTSSVLNGVVTITTGGGGPTATPAPATATSAPATATSAPATATSAPATATSAPATSTPAQTVVPTTAGPTATATRTPIRPTATPGSSNGGATQEDEGGCQIGSSASGSATWFLILPAVGLLIVRRRTRR